MPLAGLESTTGTTIYVSAAEPATHDVGGFEDLTWTEVVGVVSFGAWGDESNDISEPLLSEGRTIHQNGLVDGGSVPVVVQHRTTDAGSDIIKANAGSNTIMSVKKVYAESGDGEYASGVFSARKQREASNDSVRGYTCNFMANTSVVEATAAEIAAENP